MIREIVLDTETTGIDPANGDRIVEIGCVELFNHIPTGKTYQVYINPERQMPPDAFRVHGLSDEFLKDKPVFAVIAADFSAFLGDDRLVIHNAAFDIGFINAEFSRLGIAPLSMERVVDTLALARRKHPGQQNNLDALANRYGIDTSKRTKHGALLDSEILAEVYIELIGGKQANFGLGSGPVSNMPGMQAPVIRRNRQDDGRFRLSDAERENHRQFIARLGEKALWRSYLRE